jgi:mRNA-degrading endonuclease RelE of RelBE toxin-antitoxin system
MAKVTLTREAAEGLEDLPLVIHSRVLWLLERLAKWPAVSGAKPLTGPLAGRYRLRTGNYRLQFHVEAQGRPKARESAPETPVVIVEKIGHRDKFYE